MPIKIIRKAKVQLPVEEGQKFRNDDPVTSRDAAALVDVQPIEQTIIDCLKGHPGGLTNRQICEHTGLEWNTASPRMRPLARKNVIREDGKRQWGKWPAAIVWKLV